MARSKDRKALGGPQKGVVSESQVFTAVVLQTDGRLRWSHPQPDDHGIDGKVYQPGSPLCLDLQVKACYSIDRAGFRNFKVRLHDLPLDNPFFWVLCVEMGRAPPHMAPVAWLIPAEAFPRRGRRGTLHIAMRPTGPLKSKWDGYRIQVADLGTELLGRLTEGSRRAGLTLPPPQWKGVTDTAVGRVGEDALSEVLVDFSDGRLCVLRPTADTVGVDLNVMALDSRLSAGIQVKTVFIKAAQQWVLVTVRARKVRARPDRFIAVVPYLRGPRRMGKRLWVIPEDRFLELARRQGTLLRFRASMRDASRDRWRAFRCTPGEAAARLEGAIALRAKALGLDERGRAP